MSLETYADLQSAIANWLDRSDLTSRIQDFIELAEDQVNRDLRVMDMETQVTIPIVGDTYPLPADFLEMRNIYTDGNPRAKLRFLSPEALTLSFPWQNESPTEAYTIKNGNIVIAPPNEGTLSNAKNIVVDYYKRFEKLSATNTSNWLTQNAFDLLLFSGLSEANAYLMKEEAFFAWQRRYQNSLERLNTTHENARFSGAAIEVRSPYSGV